MTQAINILNNNLSSGLLNFLDRKTREENSSGFNYRIARPNPVNANSHEEDGFLDWLNNVEFVSVTNVSKISQNRIFYSDRLVVKFKLVEKYRAQFVLLRGLFAFRKPSGISITSDRVDNSFTVELQVSAEKEAAVYFDSTFKWLTKEIRFKQVLKEVIRFESKVKHEQALLSSTLINSVR